MARQSRKKGSASDNTSRSDLDVAFPPYSTQQNLLLAMQLADLVNREWLAELFEPQPHDPFLAALAINIYAYALAGSPLHKKAARELSGVDDVKAGRKYIATLLAHDLIEVVRASDDRRKEILVPTEKLNAYMKWELRKFAKQIRWLMYGLLDAPLPNTGDPHFARERFTSDGGNTTFTDMLISQLMRQHLRRITDDTTNQTD